jgi:hypothetical protein
MGATAPVYDLDESAGAWEVAMLRRTDAFAFLGIAMLLGGSVLYFTGSSNRISLVYWLGGPLLWFAGFALVVGSMAARWLPQVKETRGSSVSSKSGTTNPEPLQKGHR